MLLLTIQFDVKLEYTVKAIIPNIWWVWEQSDILICVKTPIEAIFKLVVKFGLLASISKWLVLCKMVFV